MVGVLTPLRALCAADMGANGADGPILNAEADPPQKAWTDLHQLYCSCGLFW